MRSVLPLLLLLFSIAVLAQPADVPLTNWTVPPYTSASPNGIHAMVDQTPPRAFIGLPVCRLLDTRPPANNPLDGDGIFGTDQIRTYTLPGSCGIPTGTEAVSLNITVTNTVSNPFGHIKIWPADQAEPNVSTLNWAAGSVTESNAAIVALSVTPAGQIKVKSGNAGSDVIIDTNGYFSDTLGTTANQFEVRSSGGVAIFGQNTASGYGVWGVSATGYGVVAGGGAGGVWATTDGAAASGVFGQHTGAGYGVHGWTQTGSGVVGRALATTGDGKGVVGETASASLDGKAAGVLGLAGPPLPDTHSFPVGVRGDGRIGVAGFTPNQTSAIGVLGKISGSTAATGALGAKVVGIDYGVYSLGDAHVQGTFTAATNKGFVQPHPHDASKEIRYISLEGRHTEVYFRGTAQVSQGVTRIPIPTDFRFVADPATYSTLVTPVGGMATVAVLSEGPEGVVVQASRNIRVHYVIFAEREAVRNLDPVIENVHFRPDPDRDPLAHLPDSFRRLMIQNGTLNADGSVNMETARRLGWDKEWEKRKQPATQPE